MGNVKPAYIKKLALELIERFPDKFTDDFEENKVLVEKLTTISTKNMRNRIAGYIARIMEDRKSKNET
ncbi:MAG: 30S ribosomal protein S17e [Thermoplasmata archaeon]|nr:30S ribosomal protein S17e [Thermoplasmata archaeon]